MATRIEVLQKSLEKKQAAFDQRLSDHMQDVKAANGQPLNDKRGGREVMARWGKQDDAMRNQQASIAKTEAAIEREQYLIANAASSEVPHCLRGFLDAGQITQWRKYPNRFFVVGVEHARIVVLKTGIIAHQNVSEIKGDDRKKFAAIFNAAKQIESNLQQAEQDHRGTMAS